MPAVNLKQLLEAGVHFGHQTSKWNPKMKQYIFTARNGIHIIDLAQTVNLLDVTQKWVTEIVSGGGSVLFVGTKKQAQGIIEEEAKRSNQFYVNHRWMGGMLTNFSSMQQRFRRMKDLREIRDTGGFDHMAKKDTAIAEDELEKLERNFGGMADLKRLPSAVFVVDPRKEHIAVTEARKLRIPIIAITDSNCDPELIDHVIPGNDDAIRAVKLISSTIANACLEGRAVAAARAQEAAEGLAAELAEAEAREAAEAPRGADSVLEGVDPSDIPAADEALADEVKPEPVVNEEEFARELEGLDDQDKIK
ncbi:MAG: 30S ribosomal protein S2 [Candidatus Dormibacteria bacterium]